MTIFLFRAQSHDDPDEYQLALTQHGYDIHFIPVLEFAHESIAHLADLMSKAPQHTSLLITSQRAVESWVAAKRQATTIHPQWHDLNLYIVGSKTAQQLNDLSFFTRQPTVASRATELAPLILADRPESILFLAGDKRRDVLPDQMAAANIPMLEIQAYKTCMHPQLEERLNTLTCTKDDWLVLFSPSGVDYIQQLEKHPLLASCKLAAIGPTTADHLQQMGLSVHAVAEKPRASYLADAIIAHDQQQH